MTFLKLSRASLFVLSSALVGASLQIDGAVQRREARLERIVGRVTSVYALRPVRINGLIQSGEWAAATANQFQVTSGWVAVQNDDSFLYLLADLTGDTRDDPPLRGAPWGDYVSLTFDVDLDRQITANVDKLFGFYPGTHDLGVSLYLRSGALTGLGKTTAKLGTAFGRSENASEPHRICEFSIPLSEINASPGGRARLGVEAHSQNPAFHDFYPRNLMNDFANLYEIALAKKPPPGPAADPAGQPGTTGQIGRRVLPDGTIEFSYPDGHRKQIHPRGGGFTIIDPDGTRHPVLFANSVYPSLPALPQGSNLRQWFEKLSEELLGYIKTTLNNNQAEIDAYLQLEGNISLGEQIISRSRFIYNLIPR